MRQIGDPQRVGGLAPTEGDGHVVLGAIHDRTGGRVAEVDLVEPYLGFAARPGAPASAWPTAWEIRPQFGSRPAIAVLTSGDSATARATRSASAASWRR